MGTNQLLKDFPETRAGESVLSHLIVPEVSVKSCPNCSHPIPVEALQCHLCRHTFHVPRPKMVSLRGIIIGVGVVGMLALAIAPVWPAERVYGKVINLLAGWGVAPLSIAVHEPGLFRELIGWVLKVYLGLHAIHYLAIVGVIGLLVVNWFKTKQLAPGNHRKLWVLLGILLLVFPAANLLISWHLFLMPGVLGTALVALLVLAMGVFR